MFTKEKIDVKSSLFSKTFWKGINMETEKLKEKLNITI